MKFNQYHVGAFVCWIWAAFLPIVSWFLFFSLDLENLGAGFPWVITTIMLMVLLSLGGGMMMSIAVESQNS